MASSPSEERRDGTGAGENKMPPTRFSTEARFPHLLAPVLGVGDAFEHHVHPFEVDGFQDPTIHVK